MRAISVWQPYASLLAVGAKKVETRHWPAHAGMVGERVAIHASKTSRDLDIAHGGLFKQHLDRAADAGRLALVDNELPLGYILATARLSSCDTMGADFAQQFTETEITFGWFAPERYAWVFDDLDTFPEPIPWRGAQGVFRVADSVVSR